MGLSGSIHRGGGPKSLKGLILEAFQFFIPTGQVDSAGQSRSENHACLWGVQNS
jgi:hypothetical protein